MAFEGLIDTHCHLDAPEFGDGVAGVLERARAAGVSGFIVPAVERANFDAVQALSDRHPDVRHALGIHPLYVTGARPSDLELLEQQLAQGGAIAVGEIGLDHYVSDIDPELQREYFVAQLKLARRFGLPVILHVRRAIDAILKELRRIEVPGGIAHAFNGSRQQADIFVAMGFKLGFGGSSTYSGSTRIRALAATLPAQALVLETDAPDIRPEWAQDRANEPQNLPRIASIIAELRGTSVEELVQQTACNARSVFPGLSGQT
ncbi:MAG: TatD family hydrolase [Pseudazoarcus pumilus]|mgnify:CR=1 FL=1|nr:TatD family hydrolase [Pseudazoarcus pumilus]